jgi:uncharacterized protein
VAPSALDTIGCILHDAIMDLESLSAMSSDSLFDLARSMGLELPPGLERPFVLEEILDLADSSLDDEPDEALDAELSKFDATLMPTGKPLTDSLHSIRYNETRFVVLLKDPAWAYLYWDIKADPPTSVEEPEPRSYLIRVLELATPFDPSQNAISWFEFSVSGRDGDWHVNLPEDGTSYVFELVQIHERRKKLLARSNVISVPRLKQFDDFRQLSEQTQRLYELSGLYSFVRQPEVPAAGCRLSSVLDGSV